jgi:hypothetical protein
MPIVLHILRDGPVRVESEGGAAHDGARQEHGPGAPTPVAREDEGGRGGISFLDKRIVPSAEP